MATTASSTLAEFPHDLVAYVADQAERDACCVAEYLNGLRSSGEETRWTAEALLDLGAALRLRAWEEDGLTVHREAGLPSAAEAIGSVYRRGTTSGEEYSPLAPDVPLSFAVVDLSVGSFAWTGSTYVQAEILLGVPDESELVDAMARFLWEHRHWISAEVREASA